MEIESAAAAAGLVLRDTVRLEGEWRERMVEDGSWDPAQALLEISRLRRSNVADGYDAAAVDAYVGGQLWGIYQLLGKLCPTVYVWERPG